MIRRFLFGTMAFAHRGSCGLLNLTIPTLAKILGSPKIGDTGGQVDIDLYKITATLTTAYSPNDIQTADVNIVDEAPTFPLLSGLAQQRT